MKIQPILFVVCALFLTSCNAQTTAITLMNPQKGNTGHVGIIPKMENEEYRPIEGKDYYSGTLQVNEACTVEVVRLVVKTKDGQVNLAPKFDEGQKKKACKKGEMMDVYFEKEKNQSITKTSMNGEGVLLVKVNGKLKRIPIKEFKMVYPM